MSSKEGIHVYVRVRPPISDDLNYDTAVHASGNSTVNLSDRKHDVTCDYEHVFPETATQTDVFDTVQPLLNDVLNGYNGCIFAYGQTSAGKTHTMLGKNGGQYLMDYKHEWGLLPRSADYLFKELQKKEHDGSISFKVKCSFLQLYNECIYDLLNNNAPSIANNSSYDDEDIGRKDVGLKIREVSHESRSKKQRKSKQAPSNENMEVYVSGLSEFRVHSASDVITLLTLGSNNRATRATAFNESSSRSHAILTLNFEIEMLQGDANGATTIYRSKLNMVDLAGSEKMYTYNEGNSQFNNSEADGGASAQHVKELTTINKSLHALGNVIATLSSKNYKLQTQLSSNNLDDSFQLNKPTGRIPHIHVPYRDSKLTRLLQDSLGGNTRTILIACVAPTVLHVSETLSTLSFADRAKNVMVKVKANVVVDDKALLARAQAEIIRLKQLLKQALERNNSNCDNSDRIDDDDYQPNLDDIPSMGGSGGGDARYQEMMAMNAQLRKENEELQQKLYMQSVGAGSGIHGKSKKKRAKPLHQRRNEYNGRNPFDSSPLEMNGGGGSTSSIRSSNSGGSTLPQIQRPGLPPQNMKEAGYGYYDNREALRSHSYSGNSNKPNPSNQQSNGADHTHGIARISSPIHVPEDEDAIAVNKLRAKLAK